MAHNLYENEVNFIRGRIDQILSILKEQMKTTFECAKSRVVLAHNQLAVQVTPDLVVKVTLSLGNIEILQTGEKICETSGYWFTIQAA